MWLSSKTAYLEQECCRLIQKHWPSLYTELLKTGMPANSLPTIANDILVNRAKIYLLRPATGSYLRANSIEELPSPTKGWGVLYYVIEEVIPNMRIMKKIAIKLTKPQEQYSVQILNDLRGLWNHYVEIQRNSLALGNGWIGAYEFDKTFYPQLAQAHAWMKNVPSRARQEMFQRCICAMVGEMRSSHKINFRSKRRKPIKSWFFAKYGIRFTSHDQIWIPILHEIRLKEIGYLREDDIQYITSGRVLLNHDQWYLVFNMDVPVDYYERPKSTDFSNGGIGIDIGIKTYITLAASFTEGPLPLQNHSHQISLDARSEQIRTKIKHLQQIISRKVAFNKQRFGYDPTNPKQKIRKEDIDVIYHTRPIEKLQSRVRRLQAQLMAHKYDSIKKATAVLVKAKPMFIAVEELDAIELKTQYGNRRLRRENADCCFGYFLSFLKWQGTKYHIPIIEVPQYTPTTQQCSNCGHIKSGRWKLKLEDREYHCKKCGLRIDRDINAARNMLRFGNIVYPKIEHWETFEDILNACS